MGSRILSLDMMKRAYGTMRLSRFFEEKAAAIYARGGEIPGSIHLGAGEEAVALGTVMALEEKDLLSPSHRALAAILYRGLPEDRIMAEWFGRIGGTNFGLSGSTHIGDLSLGLLPINGIIGASVPIAAGTALGFKLRKERQVTAVITGDGATSTGNFHEGMNLAAAFKLPLVVICDNNQYAMSTPASILPVGQIVQRALGYDIPGYRVDGNDIVAVYEAAAEAVERARGGGGPTFIECLTYRYFGHSQFDQDKLRRQDEIAQWKEKCPLRRLKLLLLEQGIEQEVLDMMDEEAERRVDAAISYARNSRYPGTELIMRYVEKVENRTIGAIE